MQKIDIADLIVALEQERMRRGLDHKGFSTLLKISESYWSMIRKGTRTLTPNLAVSFMQQLPELTPAVTLFIMRQGQDGQRQKTANTDKPKTRSGATERLKNGH